MESPLGGKNPVPAAPSTPPRRVIIFSGHMIDAPDRTPPRFPPAKEKAVRWRLAEQLELWKVGPDDLAITGAARGGDMLFAELCAERGAEVWLFLPRPEEEFLEESVRLPSGRWEERFDALCAHPRVRRFFQHEQLDEDREGLGVHARNNLWIIEAARALAPSPDGLHALLVWDEKPTGDGPGGTSDFVTRVLQLGGHVAPPINPTTITKGYQDKLKNNTGQRKLLACDGGGIRGIISIEILARIENELRASSGNPKLVLADYFDYVAGTSTGGIIATLIALGKSMDEVRDFYIKSGAEMFEKARLWERFKTKFRNDKLSAMLREIIGADTHFGSENLQTLLMVVLRNATTDSPWPLSNNPAAKYNLPGTPGRNTELRLWQLVRASTAAPTYFPPEVIHVDPHDFVFVDGGVTMYNNPAFQLFLMATTEPYRLSWPTGEQKMLLVSVGTGASPNANANLSPDEMNLLYNAGSIPGALMSAALHEQDFLCRVFGQCLAGEPLDGEVGTVIGQGIRDVPKLFTYVRYNADLSREGIDALAADIDAHDRALAQALRATTPAHVQQMDSVDHIEEMQQVGRAVGATRVKPSHFASFPA